MNNLISEPTKTQLKKYNDLISMMKDFGSVAVAFSSGVDSTFLLNAAKDALGDHVIAVTAQSCSFPKRELNEAKAFCEERQIRHFICESEELDIEGFSQNPRNRCYLCKHELFEKIQKIAEQEKIAAIVEGSNLDDIESAQTEETIVVTTEELQVYAPMFSNWGGPTDDVDN